MPYGVQELVVEIRQWDTVATGLHSGHNMTMFCSATCKPLAMILSHRRTQSAYGAKILLRLGSCQLPQKVIFVKD